MKSPPFYSEDCPPAEAIEANQVREDIFPVPGECLDLATEDFPMLSNTERIPKELIREINGQ